MRLLIMDAAIACATLIAPRRTAVSIERILTDIAVARANARWLAMVASTPEETFASHSSFQSEPAEPRSATR
ncbi:hypothetical protein CJ177_12455 [Rhodococcus sp. ACPA1]|nr:hypothetical protein CJ177_12455 [Rhodococcus sp. ACPA1]